MSLRSTLLLATLGTAVALTLLLATHQWGLGHWPDGSVRFRYLIEDDSDRTVYEQRGRWLPSGRTPYLQEHSEYPQLATWLMGLPYLLFESHVPVGREETPAEFYAAVDDHAAYFDLHHVSMAFSLLLLLVLTALNLRALGQPPGWALLLFLPGTLYFAFNRFDAWPAAAVSGALLLQWRGRRKSAAAVLGIGAMLKWFPILLLPLFLAHNLWARDEEGAPAAGRGGAGPAGANAGGAGRGGAGTGGSGRGGAGTEGALRAGVPAAPVRTGFPAPVAAPRAGAAGRGGAVDGRGWLARLPSAVILPGLVATAVCAAILAVTWFWDHGGLEAVKYVYEKQGNRDPNPPSIVAALTVPSRWGVFGLADQGWLSRAFMLFQFLPAVLLALFPIRSRRALLLGCLTVVLGFMQFGKVFSPQWICWVTPLAILLVPRNLPCLLLIVAAELAIYIQIPVMYYETMGMPGSQGRGSPGFWAACDVRIAVLFLFWAWSFLAFLRTVVARPPAPAATS